MLNILSELQKIQLVVQEIAEAIASALNMEVEIFDENLIVVGATGRIRSKIGFKQETAHVAKYIIEGGTSCTIDRPGSHYLCAHCKIKENCFCTAALVCPVSRKGKTIGTISLLSFDEDQRRILLSGQARFIDFISRMGELIAGQAQLNEAVSRAASSEKHLKTIIDSVNEGIVAVNADASISHINKAAEKLLNIDGDYFTGKLIQNLFPDSPIPSVISTCKAQLKSEISYANELSALKIACSAFPIMLNGTIVGAVMTFNDIKTITRYADSLASRHEEVSFEDICGESMIIRNLIEKAKIIAAGRSTILLRGESGTGKELFARAIHKASPFGSGPFQVINCSAIPESLLESELFGYEEGAFTGARKGGKPGKFELADGGTLFLDEIGDMPLLLQAKLLRVLESSSFERVGGTGDYRFNVRIIAATNKSLESMVKEGLFRSDLYYRLNVIPLLLPALRERREDILLLAEYLLEKYSFLMGKNIFTIEQDVQQIFYNYDWPGNVRELENVVEYAVNFENSKTLKNNSLPRWLLTNDLQQLNGQKLKQKSKEWEADHIEKLISEYGTSLAAKKKIAAELGISITTLYRKLKLNST
ncbi:MAG: sigma 54-interacting transcriptional regulator [Bacillota bacterium]|nr:sigma 54-interacting transcriptional regulator [Bacillota bacterium]